MQAQFIAIKIKLDIKYDKLHKEATLQNCQTNLDLGPLEKKKYGNIRKAYKLAGRVT